MGYSCLATNGRHFLGATMGPGFSIDRMIGKEF